VNGQVSALDAPLLLDRYRPLVLLARGGSASVYRGRDETLGRDIAIKLFSGGGASEVDQFRKELRSLASLSHHGVVSIVDAGIDLSTPDDPRPFLVMELIQGRTIRETLADHTFSAQNIGEMGFEVAEALDYIHSRDVIHRDITPSNIMLVDYGSAASRPRARVTDFGIAIAAANGPIPVGRGSVTGTAGYLSPEQVRNEELTSATDIYSLGLVLLECFTGRLAFPGTAVDSALARLKVDPSIPPSVKEPWRSLISRMTQRDPARRPTAAETADDLRRALRSGRRSRLR
jgi:serine/threonine protein kinase